MKVFLMMAGLMLSVACHAAPVTFHISPSGNDASPGTAARPFRTFPRAQQAVREVMRYEPETAIYGDDVSVVVHGGTYRLVAPLAFGPADGGNANRRVIWKAAPGETPVISGGRRITGWAKGERGVWTARLPDVAAGRWYFRQLFVNGRRRTRARTPNEGFLTVDGPITLDKPSVFRPRKGDIRREWVERGDVEMVALQKWAELRMPMKEVREAGRDGEPALIALSGTTPASNREDNARYWLENAADMLDAPGEWFLDRATGVLSYIAMPGEDMRKAVVVAPRLTQLLRIAGDAKTRSVVNLHFKGLVFTEADWDLPPEG